MGVKKLGCKGQGLGGLKRKGTRSMKKNNNRKSGGYDFLQGGGPSICDKLSLVFFWFPPFDRGKKNWVPL